MKPTEASRHNETQLASILTEFAATIRERLERGDDFFSATAEIQVQAGMIRVAKMGTEKSLLFCKKSGESL